MAMYRKKPVVIEAITFDELVKHGLQTGANVVNGMPWSFQYKGHPITHENDDCYLIPTLEGTMKMTRGDVLITGVKGEIYPCKGDIFAATYEAEGADAAPLVESMDFGNAVRALKAGKRVARAGWNGKGMYLWLLPAAMVKAEWCREPHLREVAEANGGEIEALGSIRMMTADRKVLTGWLASQTDMLADDWRVVEG